MTGAHDEAKHPRSGDGKWTSTARDETALGDGGVELLTDGAPGSVARAMGNSRHHTFGEEWFDRYRGFERVQLMRLDPPDGVGQQGGFAVAAQRTDDVAHGLAETLGGEEGMPFGYGFDPRDPQAYAEAFEQAHGWLDTHGDDAADWARDAYQVEMTAPADSRRGHAWSEQTLTVYAANLPADARTDQVIEHADTDQMKTLVADLGSGRFYARMVAEAPGHRALAADRSRP